MIDLNDPQAVKEASRLNRRLRLRRPRPVVPAGQPAEAFDTSP